MITSLTFSLLRPIPASVGLMSDIEGMVLNTSLRMTKDSSLGTVWEMVETPVQICSCLCPNFDRIFPGYVQVSFS